MTEVQAQLEQEKKSPVVEGDPPLKLGLISSWTILLWRTGWQVG